MGTQLFGSPFSSSHVGPGAVERDAGYGHLPLSFEPNRGRMDPGIDYVARTGAGSAYLSDTGAKLAFADGDRTSSVELRLLGANRSEPVAMGRLPGSVNDLRGDDASRWQTGIPTFERVRYWAYPGISLDWHGDRRALEYSFNLTTGADLDLIALRVKGADRLSLAADGDLLIHAGERTIRQAAPVAFQPTPAGREPVEARFALHGNTVGFSLGAYDRTRPLVIDPVVLDYSTYLGGSGADAANAIAIDSSGAAYLTGRTGSSEFPVGGPVDGDDPRDDVFVAKLNPAGDNLDYATYIGGDGKDVGNGIAVDASGAAVVVGTTESRDFNTVNEFQKDQGSSANTNDGRTADAFLAKLSPDGDSLLYSTYLGGKFTPCCPGDDKFGFGAGDEGTAVALDTMGAAYIAGNTDSNVFPTRNQFEGNTNEQYPVQDTPGNQTYGQASDAFVAKIDPTQSGDQSLVYSTYLGGNAADGATGIAVNPSGEAYVTGATNSTDFNTTVNPIETNEDSPGYTSGFDVFVSKLSSAGNELLYSTYLGGSDYDAPSAIALDATGAAYVAGTTDSSDFDTESPIEPDSSGPDGFAAKLGPTGNSLLYSTYLGGSGADSVRDIAVSPAGNAFLTGDTTSTDFDLAGETEEDAGSRDAFLSTLTSVGALACSTYLGGSESDSGHGVDVAADGSAYVAGATASADFDSDGVIATDAPGTDAFASKLVASAPCEPVPSGPGTVGGDDLRVYVIVLDGLRPGEIDPDLTPNLNDLKERGTWYEQARSVMIAETTPNHVAMMTGALPEHNGISGNDWWSRGHAFSKGRMKDPRLIERETLTTTLESSCDVSTATILSKEYLYRAFGGEPPITNDDDFQRQADYHFVPMSQQGYLGSPDEHLVDLQVMNQGVLPWVAADRAAPQFAFINLGDIDRSGHIDESGAASGGGVSAARQAALTDTDNLIGGLVDQLETSGAWADTVLIFASDHGMDWGTYDHYYSPINPAGGRAVLNGGAAMYYLKDGATSSDYEEAAHDILYTDVDVNGQTLSVREPALDFLATRIPVIDPATGERMADTITLDELGMDHPNTGDIVAFANPGWRMASADPSVNPLPGNHGHAITQHQTLFVTGGHPALAAPPPGGRAVGGETVYDPDDHFALPPDEGPGNLSIAPTVAKLFGLDPPEGGYDGQPLDAAFDDWAFEPHTPCGANDGPRSTSDDDDEGGSVGGESLAGAPASQPAGTAPRKKGCKRFKSKRKRQACARKKKSR